MPPRAAFLFFVFVASLAVLTGWLVGTGGYRAPFRADIPAPETFMGARWRDLRLVFSAGVDDHLFPRYRSQREPAGGVAMLLNQHRAAEASGPRRTLSIHLDLDLRPGRGHPVPVDAAEERARRRQTIRQLMHAAGIDVVVLVREAGRTIALASPDGYVDAGPSAQVSLGEDLTLGIALAEALPEVSAEALRGEGAHLTVLLERAGVPTNVALRGFDLVAIAAPDSEVAEATRQHVYFRGDASLGRVVDLRLPAGQRPSGFRDLAEARALELRHLQLAKELGVDADQEAKHRMVQLLWDRLAEDYEATEGQGFLGQQGLRILGRMPASDPAGAAQRAHLSEDEARYGPVVDGGAGLPPDSPRRAEACAQCHRDIYQAWQRTPHGLAWQSLERMGADRSPGCVTCHSTGFDPSGEDGWNTMAELRGHEAVSCVACHRPEADAPVEDHPWGASTGCQECHTPYYSPFFRPEHNRYEMRCDRLVKEMQAYRPEDHH